MSKNSCRKFREEFHAESKNDVYINEDALKRYQAYIKEKRTNIPDWLDDCDCREIEDILREMICLKRENDYSSLKIYPNFEIEDSILLEKLKITGLEELRIIEMFIEFCRSSLYILLDGYKIKFEINCNPNDSYRLFFSEDTVIKITLEETSQEHNPIKEINK